MPSASPRRSALAILLLPVVCFSLVGCDPRTKDRVMEFKPDPLAEAKSVLRAYASGQQVGSESDTLDGLTARAVAADPEKGAKVKRFFDAVVKTRRVSAAEAKKLLAEIE